ncbi:hypothetical protein [Lysinibacillus fusiformis]|uniref:hypothetical protein n=1 Tax=Lysinibacillus fusiformis TaxID=28031 RepID=UPI0020BDA033|nr:hypothetical protein [Lysinibacillus fusiformis]
MRDFELILRFTSDSKEKTRVSVKAEDEKHALEELFKKTDNGWLFFRDSEDVKFMNVNAAFEIVVVDIEKDRIETEKRTQEYLETMKNWK